MTDETSPPRNHRRTNSPQQIKLPPPMPPRPTMLATPSQGYPFPVMGGTPREEEEPRIPQKKVSVQLPTPSHRRRKAAPEGDGWDTPGSSAANSRTSTPAEDSRPFAMTRMSSTFSSSSSDATPSSSSCETPDDEAGSSSSSADVEDDDGNDYREMAAAKAARRLRKQLEPARPTTPAEMVHARTKHAGSTPGAPPPAPFYHPDFDHPPDTLLDREDVRAQEEGRSPGSATSSPATSSPAKEAKVNPLSSAVEGMSLSHA